MTMYSNSSILVLLQATQILLLEHLEVIRVYVHHLLRFDYPRLEDDQFIEWHITLFGAVFLRLREIGNAVSHLTLIP